MMELKRVDVPFEYQDSVEVIQPLEETYYDDGEYKYVTRPTEQGQMLMEFVKRHLLAPQ